MERFKNLVKNYSDDDWEGFQGFVKKEFHSKYILGDKPFFDWQYLKNPSNSEDSYSVKMLVYNNKILGYLGLLPIRLQVFDSISGNSAALCNLMVEGSVRPFGFGTYLMKSAMDQYDILWGTGYNPATRTIYEKLGNWKMMGDLNRYIKILNHERITRLIGQKVENESHKNNKHHNEITVKEINFFDTSIDYFWTAIKNKYPITVQRSADYLNWRYSFHPYFKYKILLAERKGEIVGYLVYRVSEATGVDEKLTVAHILDLISEKEAIHCLLQYFEKKAELMSVDIADYFSTGLFHHKEFIQSGYHQDIKFPYDEIPLYFNPISHKRQGINFLVFTKLNKEKIGNVNSWYITKGDGDKDRPNPH